MYAHGPGKIPVSPDTSHPRFIPEPGARIHERAVMMP